MMDMVENPYPEALADEDMEFLAAISLKLNKDKVIRTINLPGGFRMTNNTDDISVGVAFSGLDMIKKAAEGIKQNAPGVVFEMSMPTDAYEVSTKVGELFGMIVLADPDCGKDRFLIKAVGS